MAEILVTVLVVLLVIAAMKIPALGDALGRLLRGHGRSPQPPPRTDRS